MSRTQIFEWHKCLEKGREEEEDDDPKTGRVSTTRTVRDRSTVANANLKKTMTHEWLKTYK